MIKGFIVFITCVGIAAMLGTNPWWAGVAGLIVTAREYYKWEVSNVRR